jgi:hypothetical protein
MRTDECSRARQTTAIGLYKSCNVSNYLLIVHGQECTYCQGGAKRTSGYETLKKIRAAMEEDR